MRQQCGVGIVPVRTDARGRFALDAPPTAVRPMEAATRVAIIDALRIPPEAIVRCAELQNGPVRQAFELDSADAVLAVDASRVRWPQFRSIGLIGPRPAGEECDWEVRMLAPSSGMSEDPITGSLNAAIARWRRAQGRLPAPTTVAQGTAIGHSGRVSVVPEGDAVWIGGPVHVLVEGTLRL